MATTKKYVVPEAKPESSNLREYIFGFVSSVALTIVAYLFAIKHIFSGYVLIVALIELAILQFIAQLFFFLHFGKGKSAKYRLLTLVLMIFFVLVVILGSIWIISSLNYNMSPDRMENYMTQQISEGF